MNTILFDESIYIGQVKYNFKDKLIFLFYSLYFILNPFYLWKSGLPQIADIMLLLLITVYLISNKFKISFHRKNLRFLIVSLSFVLWIAIVNLIWTLRIQTTNSFIIPTLFYIYNFIVITIVVALYDQYNKKIIDITYKAVLVSVIIQMILFIMGGGFSGGRMTASFNNPNQLGYYSLLVLSFLLFISYKLKIRMKWFVLGVLSSMILVFASLSKAAIVSFIGLLFSYFISNKQNKKFKINLIITIVIIFLLVSVIDYHTNVIKDNLLINSVQTRIQGIGSDSDDSLEGRGYDRIFEYPEYWIFGAGEGEYSRFENQRMEFHSTLGNIQVSYGLVGSLIFISTMLVALRNNRYENWYILIFLMAYGLTHNGIRNSLLWILLALIGAVDKKHCGM